MTPNQYLWAQARDRLVAAVTGIGFSAELAELMARQLGSPKAIDRMTSNASSHALASLRFFTLHSFNLLLILQILS